MRCDVCGVFPANVSVRVVRVVLTEPESRLNSSCSLHRPQLSLSITMSHGAIHEVFPDVFYVQGAHRAEFFGSIWQFSKNMTIVREGKELTLFNSVKLTPTGLAALDALGKVTNVVRLGDMHGCDDAFYTNHYGAKYWAAPGMKIPADIKQVNVLADDNLPLKHSSVFFFQTTSRPEAILRLDRDGGILVACDALQVHTKPQYQRVFKTS